MNTTTSRPAAVDAADTLPDDPRECCKAIIDELRKVDEWPVSKLPQDFAALVRVLCTGEPDDLAEAMPAMQRMASEAENAAKLYHDAVHAAWALVAAPGDHPRCSWRWAR